MAWALVDHGLSIFVRGADADHNENKNKMSIHENTQSSTKSPLQFLIQFPPEMVENWWRYGGEHVTK